MKIILIRHGQKKSIGSTDLKKRRAVCLTGTGIKQISSLAGTLLKEYPQLINLEKIYASPYPRCVQSAEIIRNCIGLEEVESMPVFEEFYAYDDYTLKPEKRRKLMERAMLDTDWIVPQTGLSMRMQLDKIIKSLKRLAGSGVKFIVIVSHGAIIRNLVYRIDQSFRPNDDNILEGKINDGGYTELEYKNNIFEVVKFDVADHLKTISKSEE